MGGSLVSFQGLSKARARLQAIANGLREAAGGEVVAAAAAKVQTQVDSVAKSKTEAHRASGHAADTAKVTTSGGLVQLTTAGYLRFHRRWWPFYNGMPPFVVKAASRIFAAELLARIGGGNTARALATAVVLEEQAEGAARTAKKVASATAAATKRREKAEERARAKAAAPPKARRRG